MVSKYHLHVAQRHNFPSPYLAELNIAIGRLQRLQSAWSARRCSCCRYCITASGEKLLRMSVCGQSMLSPRVNCCFARFLRRALSQTDMCYFYAHLYARETRSAVRALRATRRMKINEKIPGCISSRSACFRMLKHFLYRRALVIAVRRG